MLVRTDSFAEEILPACRWEGSMKYCPCLELRNRRICTCFRLKLHLPQLGA